MSRTRLLSDLLVERYAPPPPPADTTDGPTAQWAIHERKVTEIRRLYFELKLTTEAVAARMCVPWHEVVGVVEGWTA